MLILYIISKLITYGVYQMKKQTVIDYFGGKVTDVAKALEITQGAVSLWKEDKIPLSSALRVQEYTGGELSFDPKDYVGDLRKKTNQQPTSEELKQ